MSCIVPFPPIEIIFDKSCETAVAELATSGWPTAHKSFKHWRVDTGTSRNKHNYWGISSIIRLRKKIQNICVCFSQTRNNYWKNVPTLAEKNSTNSYLSFSTFFFRGRISWRFNNGSQNKTRICFLHEARCVLKHRWLLYRTLQPPSQVKNNWARHS